MYLYLAVTWSCDPSTRATNVCYGVEDASVLAAAFRVCGVVWVPLWVSTAAFVSFTAF